MGTSKGEGTKQRVNRCLSKMSDRDTEAMAASELESMARALAPDALPAFVAAVSDARPTDRAPLRRHSLRVLALLPASHPAEAVAPLLPRMLSAALRRLRDPDSSVRAAYVDAVRSVAVAAVAAGAAPQVVLRPLTDALLHEQDQCAQLAAALCLAATVDASDPGDPDLARHLRGSSPAS
ncbi:Microtubule-associated protein SPIRAL2-like [Ananas comosus]|uniref:Microtubule-associated protein SPIRAL2-like n=1 Tax=Ananas comosus TaxID=4615 RepID=A0A199VKM3_ANACO|nr:Microtubule-associated protein SPIRAL2-like [Ananas comosus]